jgi:hypothetical protein
MKDRKDKDKKIRIRIRIRIGKREGSVHGAPLQMPIG